MRAQIPETVTEFDSSLEKSNKMIIPDINKFRCRSSFQVCVLLRVRTFGTAIQNILGTAIQYILGTAIQYIIL